MAAVNTAFAALLGVALATGAAGVARAHDSSDGVAHPSYDEAEALAYSQGVIGQRIGDVTLTDRRGDPVELAAYRGRPLIVSFVYTSCYHTCPVLTQTLAHAVSAAQEALGEDSFSVVTVGFDAPADTPARMRAFAREQGVDLPNWRFLSGDATTIDRLAAELGFIFFPSPKGFDHLAQTTIVDGEGRVYKQVYGDAFSPPSLVEPLKQLVFGADAGFTTISGLVNQVRLFCTIYDPSSERYRFDYSLFVGMAIGFLSLSAVGFVLVRAWLGSGRTG